ncbi:hypothetical protein B0H12DRAFT_1159152 [Mycena haematopus]|nr:hypothetical protein B0H12DRAFT_1159152 [Mycena haematopus]
MRSSFNDEPEANFTPTPQYSYGLPGTAHQTYESRILDPLVYPDVLMSPDGPDETYSTPSTSLKRKQNTLDSVLLSPLYILDPTSAMGPSPNKKARQHPQGNSDLRSAQSGRNPGRNFGDTEVERSPPLWSPLDSERDGFVPDIESSLESILNQLAEDENQRREQQERYVSSLSGVVSDSSGQNTPVSIPNPSTDVFLPSDAETSDDELLQNLFDDFQSLNLEPESYADAQPDPEVDIRPNFPLPDGSSLYLYQERNDGVESSSVTTGSSFSGTNLPDDLESDVPPWTAADSAKSNRGETQTLKTDAVFWGEPDDEEMPLHGNSFDSDSDEPGHDSGLIPAGSQSHCPCNQCSPRPPHPDYHPSRHSQQEIHRLFLLSPFAHPTHSTR